MESRMVSYSSGWSFTDALNSTCSVPYQLSSTEIVARLFSIVIVTCWLSSTVHSIFCGPQSPSIILSLRGNVTKIFPVSISDGSGERTSLSVTFSPVFIVILDGNFSLSILGSLGTGTIDTKMEVILLCPSLSVAIRKTS